MKECTWIVSELFYPDSNATAYIMTEIANQIAIDQDVKVICGPTGYAKASIDNKARLRDNIEVRRIRGYNWDKNHLFLRIVRLICLTAHLGSKLFWSVNKGDKVIMVTNPAPLLLLVSKICRWKKLKLVIIVHDVFPENLKAAKILSHTNIVFKILLYLFNRSYCSANHLIVLGRDMRDLLLKKTNIKKGANISIIENWADLEDVYPIRADDNGPLRLQFAGNFGRVQGLMRLLEAIKLADNSKVVYDFIGSGAMLTDMQQYIKAHNLINVNILPPFRRSEQCVILSNCNIGIVPLTEGMLGLGVPSKTYNILAAGKPILYIGAKQSEISLMLSEEDVGWSFTDYGEELICFLRSLDDSKIEEISMKGNKARILAEEKYSKLKKLNQYRSVIKEV